jgi:hypothetical protein
VLPLLLGEPEGAILSRQFLSDQSGFALSLRAHAALSFRCFWYPFFDNHPVISNAPAHAGRRAYSPPAAHIGVGALSIRVSRTVAVRPFGHAALSFRRSVAIELAFHCLAGDPFKANGLRIPDELRNRERERRGEIAIVSNNRPVDHFLWGAGFFKSRH